MNIAIVGLGLIGGSIAKALKKRTPHTVLGMDTDQQVIYKALLLDSIDNVLNEEKLGICDFVIVATYPAAAVEFVEKHAASFKPGAIVMDVCGVKKAVCEPLMKLAENYNFTFVGGHPMAGIEYSGFDHSTNSMFENASMILTPPPGMDIQFLDMLKQFWCTLGFRRVVITTPDNHDRIIAYTSQLAHVVSGAYILSPTALDHDGFSAGSYKDMTRVARLNETMWTELFLDNKDHLVHEIDSLMEHLSAVRNAISDGNADSLKELLRYGREQKELADKKDFGI